MTGAFSTFSVFRVQVFSAVMLSGSVVAFSAQYSLMSKTSVPSSDFCGVTARYGAETSVMLETFASAAFFSFSGASAALRMSSFRVSFTVPSSAMYSSADLATFWTVSLLASSLLSEMVADSAASTSFSFLR